MMVIELCWFAFRIACFLYLQLMTSSRVKHAFFLLRQVAATNNVVREQDKASKEKTKTMVEEL